MSTLSNRSNGRTKNHWEKWKYIPFNVMMNYSLDSNATQTFVKSLLAQYMSYRVMNNHEITFNIKSIVSSFKYSQRE